MHYMRNIELVLNLAPTMDIDQEHHQNMTTIPESNIGSSTDKIINTTTNPKRRRGTQKRVVSVPIKDVEGSKLKGETPPPPDSWAWRKYGQKPIKGSPYPRGYYRCSSSKGCPARKQVERSSVDPNMLVVTYSFDHNHPSRRSPSGNRHHNSSSAPYNDSTKPEIASTPLPEDTLSGGPMLMTATDEFTWFGEMEMTPSTVLDSPIFANKGSAGEADLDTMFTTGEEEEEKESSLFADLGELPECSIVFRHRNVGSQVEIC